MSATPSASLWANASSSKTFEQIIADFMAASKFECEDPEELRGRINKCLYTHSRTLDLSNVAGLEITIENMRHSILPFLTDNDYIKEMHLGGADINGKVIAELANNCKLEVISCNHTNINSEGVIALAKNKHIRKLDIAQTSFCLCADSKSKEAIEALSHSLIEWLDMSGEYTPEAPIDEAGAVALISNKNLVHLDISGQKVSFKKQMELVKIRNNLHEAQNKEFLKGIYDSDGADSNLLLFSKMDSSPCADLSKEILEYTAPKALNLII
jgi:hypothetical protein